MKRILRTLGGVIGLLSPIYLLSQLLPIKQQAALEHFPSQPQRPLNIAHRGGGDLAPEETLEAFALSLAAGCDMFEYDVHITADGHLIASHDPTVDRITNGSGIINEMTLAEIKALDAGANYRNEKGEAAFAGQGVVLATVEEIFQTFPDTPAVIELKHDNYPSLYEAMIKEIWRLIQLYGMEDKVIIGSFDHQINLRFQAHSQGRVAIGAGMNAAASYILKLLLRLPGYAQLNAKSLQLPTKMYGVDLTKDYYLNAHRQRGIATYFWTINDRPTMERLIARGVDGIMTDNPLLLSQVLQESNN